MHELHDILLFFSLLHQKKEYFTTCFIFVDSTATTRVEDFSLQQNYRIV